MTFLDSKRVEFTLLWKAGNHCPAAHAPASVLQSRYSPVEALAELDEEAEQRIPETSGRLHFDALLLACGPHCIYLPVFSNSHICIDSLQPSF